MEFTPHTLSPTLAPHLGALFHYRGLRPEHSIERVVPTGHIFLIFELDGIPRHTYGEDLQPNGTYTHAWVAGNRHTHLAISTHQDSEMLVAQFKPAGARPFVQRPVDQLSELVVPALDVFGESVVRLRDELLEGDAPAKLERAQSWLEGRLAASEAAHALPQELEQLLRALAQATPADYGAAFENYPHTQKHLIDQFKAWVGLTPKTYQRVMRFNEILGRIHGGEQLPWAELALECGYADQSHFIREFRRFSGFRPSDFVAAGFEDREGNFFPLDG